MRRYARRPALAAALCWGIWALATTGAVSADADEDKKVKEAQKDVVELAKEVEGGKTDEAKAKAIRKKYDELDHLMYIFKPRDKGGLGFGPKGKGDGIELKIISLGKRALSDEDLKAQRAELIKMAYVTTAMSEVVQQYAPAKPKGGKGAKEWKAHAAGMKKASQELIAAVKKGSPDAVKAAAGNLNGSCTSCHTDFRDTAD
jgi:cytochrome c556